jgi:hypothetical protein
MSRPFSSPTRPGSPEITATASAFDAGTGVDSNAVHCSRFVRFSRHIANHPGCCGFMLYLYGSIQNIIGERLDRFLIVLYLYDTLQNKTERGAFDGS